MSKRPTSYLAGSVLIGTAIGAVVGLLAAPMAGSEMRGLLRKRAKDAAKDLPDQLKQVPEALKEVPNRLKDLPEALKGVPETLKNVPETLKDVPDRLKAIPETLKDLPERGKEIGKQVLENLPESGRRAIARIPGLGNRRRDPNTPIDTTATPVEPAEHPDVRGGL